MMFGFSRPLIVIIGYIESRARAYSSAKHVRPSMTSANILKSLKNKNSKYQKSKYLHFYIWSNIVDRLRINNGS